MTKAKMTIEEKKAKKAAYDKARREKLKAEKASVTKAVAKPTQKVVKPKAIIKAAKTVKPAATPKVQKTSWKSQITWGKEVEVTMENRKQFWDKKGYIKVINKKGETVHVGRTGNMGKVFSNYIHCDRYNQSYEFKIGHGDKLMFLEQ